MRLFSQSHPCNLESVELNREGSESDAVCVRVLSLTPSTHFEPQTSRGGRPVMIVAVMHGHTQPVACSIAAAPPESPSLLFCVTFLPCDCRLSRPLWSTSAPAAESHCTCRDDRKLLEITVIFLYYEALLQIDVLNCLGKVKHKSRLMPFTDLGE